MSRKPQDCARANTDCIEVWLAKRIGLQEVRLNIPKLDNGLEPTSIAVAGASAIAGSLGEKVWRELNSGVYKGKLYAVNAHYGELVNSVVYGRVQDLPVAPELAIVCAAPAQVAGLVEAFGKLGTTHAVVLTEGMTADQQSATLAAAERHAMQILDACDMRFSTSRQPEAALVECG
jgi:acetyltransferase